MNKLTSKLRLFASLSATVVMLNGCTAALVDTEALKAEAEYLKEDSTKIDARVDATLEQLYQTHPHTQDLSQRAAGMLVMPLITEASFGFGGSYGRGALRAKGETVEYYSMASAGYGWQFGAQQYAHALFFMSSKALDDFRNSDGWTVGGDIDYAFQGDGESLRLDTTTLNAPVIAVVFGQAGLKFGVSLEGAKYTRILP